MSERDDLTPEQTRRARELLDAREPDAHTVQRLARVRAAALRGESSHRARPTLSWRPVAGLAVAASLTLAVVLHVARDEPNADQAVLDDMEVLLAQDDLELYRELEFYEWLDDENS